MASVSIITADPQSSTLFKHDDEDPPQSTADAGKAVEMGMLINEVDDTKTDVQGELTIPESTHSFLFTEPVTSPPFLFSLYIAVMSYGCLIIAFIDNVKHNDVPENVEISVRIAQYMAILIALLMEEEIPTALHLLKRISKQHLQSKFPGLSYWRFVASSLLRFSLGYLFLVNVFVILIQANNVLEIFYDVLALQFLQQLDDIAFTVSQREVLGKRMYLATMVSWGINMGLSDFVLHAIYFLPSDYRVRGSFVVRRLSLQLALRSRTDLIRRKRSSIFSKVYTCLIYSSSWR